MSTLRMMLCTTEASGMGIMRAGALNLSGETVQKLAGCILIGMNVLWIRNYSA